MPDRRTCPACARAFGSAAALADHHRATHDNPAWTPGKTQPKAKPVPMCPSCGKTARVAETRYGARCACDACGLWSWGLKPLVDAATHQARNAAHAALDPLWKGGTLTRGECYRRLQVAMGMTALECHISVMDAAQALRVVEIVRSGRLVEMADA
jgi:zinc-finger-containing domain